MPVSYGVLCKCLAGKAIAYAGVTLVLWRTGIVLARLHDFI